MLSADRLCIDTQSEMGIVPALEEIGKLLEAWGDEVSFLGSPSIGRLHESAERSAHFLIVNAKISEDMLRRLVSIETCLMNSVNVRSFAHLSIFLERLEEQLFQMARLAGLVERNLRPMRGFATADRGTELTVLSLEHLKRSIIQARKCRRIISGRDLLVSLRF